MNEIEVVRTGSGARLAVDQVGTGPAVLLTHGWVVGAEMWEYVSTRLAAAGFRTIGVTRRGCGRSSRPPGGYDLDTLADDLADVVKTLELSDATLVAHSVGGPEAVRMISRHRAARIGRLVLVATTTPGPAAAGTADGPVRALVDQIRRDRPRYVRDGVPAFFGRSVPPEMADWAVGLTLRASMSASVGVLTSGAQDTRTDLTDCRIPALVIHGAADETAPLETCGRASHDLLPDSRLLVYADAPHGLPLTHPARLADDIEAFVRQTSTAARVPADQWQHGARSADPVHS